jgi:hypothetical protein
VLPSLLCGKKCFHITSASEGSFEKTLGESEVCPLDFGGIMAGTQPQLGHLKGMKVTPSAEGDSTMRSLVPAARCRSRDPGRSCLEAQGNPMERETAGSQDALNLTVHHIPLGPC